MEKPVPKHTEFYQDVAIIGLGLIGGSIAKDIRSHSPKANISAIDSNVDSLNQAIKEGVVDQSISYDELGNAANFIILATPIDHIVSTAIKIKEVLSNSANNIFEKYIVIDTASIKEPIAVSFRNLSSPNLQFLATHPMAGTEYVGWSHAKKDLFRAKPWIICGHNKNDVDTIESVSGFVRDLGSRIRLIEPSEHDKQAALVSHSVIMLSNLIFDYVATTHPDALDLAGDGFTSTTRLASGNPELHGSIVAHNADNTFEFLDEFRQFLSDTIDLQKKSDHKGLTPYFASNMDRRNKWLRRRG